MSEANYAKVRAFRAYLDAGRKANTATNTECKAGNSAAEKRAETQAIRE